MENASSLNEAEKELKSRIHTMLEEKVKEKRIIPLYRKIAVAASFLLIIGLTVFILTRTEKQVKPIAKNINPPPSLAKEALPSVNDNIKTEANTSQNTVYKKAKEPTISPLKHKAEISDSIQPSMSEIQYNIVENEDRSGVADKVLDTVYIEEQFASAPIQAYAEESKKESILDLSTKHEKIVTGKVRDSNGEPIPGVNVMIKGTYQGTITDIDGKFALKVEDTTSTLTFSFVGYKQEDYSINKSDNIDVKLNEEVTALNEVVVVGYGSRKKTDLTGAVSRVGKGSSSKKKEVIESKSLTEGLSQKDADEINVLVTIIEKNIEANEKESALSKLQILYSKVTGDENKKDIQAIIDLVKEGKFEKALKRLKKLR